MNGLDWVDYTIGFCTILPWSLVVVLAFPRTVKPKEWIGIFLALFFGWLSTYLILQLHPILWPETDFVSKKKVSLLTQTAHLAFIQAGMTEETCKIFFIMLLSAIFGYDRKKKFFSRNVVLWGAFVALGFSLIENSHYIAREPMEKKWNLFLARTIHSSNIHLLINLCFSLFLVKSNHKPHPDRWYYLCFAFFLAVAQHGVVDFLLIPGATIGLWIATAMFVGIWVWVVGDWKKFLSQRDDKNTRMPASEYSSQSNV